LKKRHPETEINVLEKGASLCGSNVTASQSVERQLRGGLRPLTGTTLEFADLDPEVDDQKLHVVWNWFENASAISNSRSAQQWKNQSAQQSVVGLTLRCCAGLDTWLKENGSELSPAALFSAH
jgi:hypothetical protein